METQSPRTGSAVEPDTTAAASAKSGRASADSSESSGAAHDESAAKAFRNAAGRAAEIGEYASYYVSTKLARLKLHAHGAMVTAFAIFAGLLAVGAIVVVAIVLLLVGAANALSVAMGDRLWAGQLIVAGGALAVLFVGARVMVAMLYGSSRKKTVEKYESRKREQHARFGRDVAERAEECKR